MRKLFVIQVLACLLAWLVPLSAAYAHNGSVKYIDVSVSGADVSATVSVDAADAAAATGMGSEIDAARLAERAEVVRAWMLRGLRVDSDGEPCSQMTAGPQLRAERVAIVATYVCASAAPITLTDASLSATDDGHKTLVSVDGARPQVLRGNDSTVSISEPVTTAAIAASFVWEGVIHLVTGYDHVLFLLSLLFGAGVLARRRGVKIAGKDIALVVTAFTVGHSVTLVLASLEIVMLPARFVESVIAASIVAVAALNIAKPESSAGRPSIALAFGLIHGFGFSSVLADVGLPAGERFVALLSFNVGIELAQLAVVAIVIAPLAWLAKQERFYRAFVMRGGSIAIAALACFWLVERALGL